MRKPRIAFISTMSGAAWGGSENLWGRTALRLLEQGLADADTIDALMEASGFKMGPFRLMDLIGNDINYAVSCSVYEAMGKPLRLQPSPIQEQKVKAGELGRKSGKGYYTYLQ